MKNDTGPARPIDWRLPERRFTGTPEEVADAIEQLVVTLVACRQTIAVPSPGTMHPARPPALWRRVLGALGPLILVVVGVSVAGAQGATSDREPPPEAPVWHDVVFGVTFEGYYQYNANNPADRVNALRTYDTRANAFGVQQAAAIVELPPAVKEGRRFGLRLDLQFGQATAAAQGNPANEPRPEVYRNVWQMFGTYVAPVGRGLQLDFGKFASNLGYETNYAKDNQAFSRAYLFDFLPFYHMGLRASIPVSDAVTLVATVTNGVQQTEDFNGFPAVEASVTLKPLDRLSWTVNYYAGREQPDGPDGTFSVFDTYATFAWSPGVSLGVDYSHAANEVDGADPSTSLDGVGAYARWQTARRTAIGLRYEWLDDEGALSGVAQWLQEVTLTLEQRLADGLLLRAEYRQDWSDIDYFPSDEGSTTRRPTIA